MYSQERPELCTIIICISVMLIYMFPISSSLDVKNHYDIYNILRLLFIPISILIIVRNHRIRTVYMLLIGVILVRAILYHGEIARILFILSLYICYDYVIERIDLIDTEIVARCIHLCSIFFLSQIILCSLYSKSLSSLVGDKNYLGFFSLLLFLFFRQKKRLYSLIWLIVGLLTFSRNFYLSIVALVVSDFIASKLKIKDNTSKYIWIITQILIIPITFIFCRLFESINYTYEYKEGLSRITSVVDQSNYFRFKVNELVLHNMTIQKMLLGYRTLDLSDLMIVKNKSIFPHNTIFVMIVQTGLINAILYLHNYIILIDVFDEREKFGAWVALSMYGLFLGPSSFYGTELMIILAVMLCSDSCWESIKRI